MFKEIMKANLKRLLLIVAGSVLLAGCCTSHHAARQWEYKVVNNIRRGTNIADVIDPKVDPELAKLGSEAWELVSYNGDRWIFKRPKK